MKIQLVLGAHAQKFPCLVKNCDQEPPPATCFMIRTPPFNLKSFLIISHILALNYSHILLFFKTEPPFYYFFWVLFVCLSVSLCVCISLNQQHCYMHRLSLFILHVICSLHCMLDTCQYLLHIPSHRHPKQSILENIITY